MSSKNSPIDFSQSRELWWQSAHLLYSLAAKDCAPLILDVWRQAEALGRARGACSSAVFNGVQYQVYFEGVRQVNLIPEATVGVGLPAVVEISYSKFEIGSQQRLGRLLDNQDCIVELLPASICNLVVPESA